MVEPKVLVGEGGALVVVAKEREVGVARRD
jgi:hypothetical protein